jgi:hypothetical protein
VARIITRLLVIGAVGAGLACADWAGQPAGPGTLISRVDVIAAVTLLVVLPGLVSRRYGPVGTSRLARLVRLAGCTAVILLVLVKAAVQRAEYTPMSGSSRLAGIWAGEILFLAVLAAYVTVILAATARRSPVAPSALAIGTGAGAVAGLLMYALPPRGTALHITTTWLASAYAAARVLAVPVGLAVGVVAGVKATRRAHRQNGKRGRADTRTRQGVAAGVFAGVAAAMTVSILGIGTIALVPHEASALQWTLPIQPHLPPGSTYEFGLTLSEAAAGYLLALIFFPLLGAGLGAWGGLYASDRPGRQPGGGGGGGGPRRPDVKPRPPAGGRNPDDERPTAAPGFGRRLLDLPEWKVPAGTPVDDPVTPSRREKTPAGRSGGASLSSEARSSPASSPAAPISRTSSSGRASTPVCLWARWTSAGCRARSTGH